METFFALGFLGAFIAFTVVLWRCRGKIEFTVRHELHIPPELTIRQLHGAVPSDPADVADELEASGQNNYPDREVPFVSEPRRARARTPETME